MKVMIKRPGKTPEIREIDGSLESLQGLVGGWIEHVGIRDGLGMILNEEGKLNCLPSNFVFRGDMIVGTAVFVGEDGEEFVDVPEAFAALETDIPEDLEIWRAIIRPTNI